MATFIWDKSIETGNELIDSEHKQLITAINDFLDACYNKNGAENLHKTLNFVNDYTIKHFFDEEQLQKGYAYPNYEFHKRFHESYKKIVRDLMVGFINHGVDDALIEKAKHDIGVVLIEHIKHEDMRLAAHIRSNPHS